MLKNVNELKDGNCLVVAKFGDTVKEFNGAYDSVLNIVFMAIPDYYEIIGYKQ